MLNVDITLQIDLNYRKAKIPSPFHNLFKQFIQHVYHLMYSNDGGGNEVWQRRVYLFENVELMRTGCPYPGPSRTEGT